MAKQSTELELLVAKIQQDLAPSAEVVHNAYLPGRYSETKRQIDVLVRQKVGQYDIQIVIDCKDYNKPVDVKGVEEFAGLANDVGAQKGVLVCPKGFTEAAKKLAQKLQIDLYSPVDTDPHKWTARVTVPALCDYRSASIAFGISMSAPYPFKFPQEFYKTSEIYSEDGSLLGNAFDNAISKWDRGGFPIDVGEHKELPIFDTLGVFMDNGYGMKVPVEIYAHTIVTRQLYFGQYPIKKISGFKDEIAGGVIANAFTVGLLDPEHVEHQWKKLDDESEAPIVPVLKLTGLVAWGA
ncbi:restriction endonuclease [Mesorhizobium sp.]|uniref:restriction endonuclease n=1 Tax=Mesorhizobium sp. TaxID=1871066 RepID=UPI0025BEACF8|nr:restriction endonuclease [Mesorhizobium sp.]